MAKTGIYRFNQKELANMTKWGMKPSVSQNPDPTFTQAAAHITGEQKKRARFAASLIFRMMELAGYTVCGRITLKDNKGNEYSVENERR
jgi:hypothetical protein